MTMKTECITVDEFIQHWNYFCSLAKKLDETKDYIYHGSVESEDDDIRLVHGQVYSDVFQQIILLAASEFEVISRIICRINGVEPRNIVEISSVILDKYPKIVYTEIGGLFWYGKPLCDWGIDYAADDNEKVKGLEWWKAYTSIKHNEAGSYKLATLKNAIFSMAALYILDLYLMFVITDHLFILHSYPPVYFHCKYEPSNVFAAEGKLPDFGNQSAQEAYKEMFSIFEKKE